MEAGTYQVQAGTVTTKVPARLDRLPWSRWHRMIVSGPLVLGRLFDTVGRKPVIAGSYIAAHHAGVSHSPQRAGTAGYLTCQAAGH